MYISLPAIRILRYFLIMGEEASGAEIIQALHLVAGTVYPILAKLKKEGFVTKRKEVITRRYKGKSFRYMYTLTKEGRKKTTLILTSLQVPKAFL